jgi:flagellar basal-body rod modification protein FlgD
MVVHLNKVSSLAPSSTISQSVLDRLNGRTGTSSTGGTGSRDSVGKDAFLKLLVTQLKNQDPTSTMQPNEFAAQLAQFSSVEQLTTLNTGISQLASQGQLNTLMSQTAFSASLVGKDIIAEGDKVDIPTTGAGHVRLDVGVGGGNAEITLTDANGHTVATRAIGRVEAGAHTVELPSDLPAGSYTYSIKCTGANGSDVPVKTFITGQVNGVHFSTSGITLRVGNLEIPLSDLSELGQP